MRRWGLLRRVAVGLLLACLSLPAASLPTSLSEKQPELRAIGKATLHWFGLHVYDIEFYAPESTYSSKGPAALSIRYNISIKHHRLVETTRKEWQRMKRGTAVQRDAWAQQLEALWPDVKSGDRLTAFQQQTGPALFYLGDRLLGEMADPEFGPAFFAIWMDADCRYPKIRAELLGNGTDVKKKVKP